MIIRIVFRNFPSLGSLDLVNRVRADPPREINCVEFSRGAIRSRNLQFRGNYARSRFSARELLRGPGSCCKVAGTVNSRLARFDEVPLMILFRRRPFPLPLPLSRISPFRRFVTLSRLQRISRTHRCGGISRKSLGLAFRRLIRQMFFPRRRLLTKSICVIRRKKSV